MNIILFTKNSSLISLWKGYKFDFASEIVSSETAVFEALKRDAGAIVGLDVDVADDVGSLIDELTQSGAKVLALSNVPNFSEGKILLSHGASGYLNSHANNIHFNDAFAAIKNGNVWLYPEFIKSMIGELTAGINSKPSSIDTLTSREKEVAEYIAKGLTNKEISELSGVTVRTVKAHTASIYEKMGVKDRLGLVLALKNA